MMIYMKIVKIVHCVYCDDGRQVGIGAIDRKVGEVGVLGLQVVEFEMVACALCCPVVKNGEV